MDAGLALEAAVSEAAERLGVDMVSEVLEPLMGRAVPRKGG